MHRYQGHHLIVVGGIALPCTTLIALFIGPTPLSFDQLSTFNFDSQDWFILNNIRLPRVILSGFIGALLAMSGAVLQGLFRNPLADPSLIGVSAGASVGASAMIVFLTSSWFQSDMLSNVLMIPFVSLAAFVGGMIAVAVVYTLATAKSSQQGLSGVSVATMLLVGIAISTLAGAINNLIVLISDNESLRQMSVWQMGNLDLANWQRVQIAALVFALFCVFLINQIQGLNAFALGESEAHHLGVKVKSIKRKLITLSGLAVGVSFALVGSIVFVGLIVPHIIRVVSGPSHKPLIINSALLGAWLLIVADLIARTVIAPAELPVGVVMAFIGVPFFVFLLMKYHRGS